MLHLFLLVILYLHFSSLFLHVCSHHTISLILILSYPSFSCRAGLGFADFGCVCLPGVFAPSPQHPSHQPSQVCSGHVGGEWGGGTVLMLMSALLYSPLCSVTLITQRLMWEGHIILRKSQCVLSQLCLFTHSSWSKVRQDVLPFNQTTLLSLEHFSNTISPGISTIIISQNSNYSK